MYVYYSENIQMAKRKTRRRNIKRGKSSRKKRINVVQKLIGGDGKTTPKKEEKKEVLIFTPDRPEKFSKAEHVAPTLTPKKDYIKDFSEKLKIEAENYESFGSSNSLNGYVLKVTTNENPFVGRILNTKTEKVFSVLKQPRSDDFTHNVDNVVYEYENGLYINKLCDYYPCFVKTISLYENKDNAVIRKFVKIEDLMNNKTKSEAIKKLNLTLVKSKIDENKPADYPADGDGYKNKNNYSLELQYIESKTYNSMMDSLTEVEKFNILFQIYAPLYILSESLLGGGEERTTLFQHNDLHANNILVYDIGELIIMTYLFDDKNIADSKNKKIKKFSIQTQYIAKMIDYGRCRTQHLHKSFYDIYLEILRLPEGDQKTHKIKFKEYLHNFGLDHVLIDHEDFNMFNRLTRSQARNYEMIVNLLMETIQNKRGEKFIINPDLPSITINCEAQPNVDEDLNTVDISKVMESKGDIKKNISDVVGITVSHVGIETPLKYTSTNATANTTANLMPPQLPSEIYKQNTDNGSLPTSRKLTYDKTGAPPNEPPDNKRKKLN